jgi:hypothetical protein
MKTFDYLKKNGLCDASSEIIEGWYCVTSNKRNANLKQPIRRQIYIFIYYHQSGIKKSIMVFPPLLS